MAENGAYIYVKSQDFFLKNNIQGGLISILILLPLLKNGYHYLLFPMVKEAQKKPLGLKISFIMLMLSYIHQLTENATLNFSRLIFPAFRLHQI